MALTTVNSSGIKDDSIVNADIKSDAAIATSKLATGVLPSGLVVNGSNIAALSIATGHIAAGTGFQISNSNVSDSAAIALSKLASTPAVLTGSTNNTICTVTGANAIQGEAGLTFDGSTMNLTAASGDARLTLIGTEGNDARISLVADDGDDHIDQWNLRSEAANHFVIDQFESGSFVERLRIDSSGRLLINTTDVPSQGADTLTVKAPDGGNAGITIRTGTGNTGNIFFSDGTSGSGEYAGYIYYAHGTDKLYFGMDAADRLVIGSGGDIEVKTGNVVIGTAGKGIDFSAQTATSASGSTTTSELLDHYEEGSFTPSFQSEQGQTPTHTNQVGDYTRIGNWVHVQLYCSWTSVLNMGSYARIGGLPFTSGNLGTGSCFLNQWNFNNDEVRDIVLHHSNSDVIFLYYTRDNGGWEPLPTDNNASIIGTMSYKVA